VASQSTFRVKFVPGMRSPASRGPVKKGAVEGEFARQPGMSTAPSPASRSALPRAGYLAHSAEHRFPVLADERAARAISGLGTFGYAAFP
jgi:hypothetical protein